MLASLNSFCFRVPQSVEDFKVLARFFSNSGFQSAEDLAHAELPSNANVDLDGRMRKLAQALITQATERLSQSLAGRWLKQVCVGFSTSSCSCIR